jgi:PilZ domain-containing protein
MSIIHRSLEPGSAVRRSGFARAHVLTDHDAASRRQTVELTATLRISGADLYAQACRVRSLSLGGAFVELERLPMGTLVNLTFGLPAVDERLSLDAIVHWCARDGVSVLFDSLRASEVWVLWRYLASLTRDTETETTKRTKISCAPAARP